MYKILILPIVLFGLAVGSAFSANIPRNGTEEIFDKELISQIKILLAGVFPGMADFTQYIFATPIKCFEWQNIYIYNHETKEFEMKFEIDEFCLESPKKS